MGTNGKQPKGATIISLEVQDFQGLKAAKLEHLPERGVIRVTGPNGAGKSSILRAIRGAIGGAGEVHERSIRDGAEDGATVHVELSNGLRIRKRHTDTNPKGHLVVTGPDGGKYAQAKLNDILGPLSFDPNAFFSLPPKRQREILLSIGKDPDLATHLDRLRAERANLYERRTPWIAKQRDARKATKPDGERPEPVNTGAEMVELRGLQAKAGERTDAARLAASARDQADRMGRRVAAQEEVIADLRRKLHAAETDLERFGQEYEAGVADVKRAEEAFAAMADPSDAIQACMDRISRAEAVQCSLKPWDAWDVAQETFREATDKVGQLTKAMDALEAKEHELIAAAGIPVRGIAFDADGSPVLNGRPLELASGGERIELAVDVALAVDPELRICLVDEANDLDLEAMDRLRRRAEQHGFQIWLCRIGLEGPGDVTVMAGEARSREQVVAAQAEIGA